MTEAVGIGKAIEDAIESSSEAIGIIGDHIAQYLEGGPDRGIEDVELGLRAGLNVELVQERWSVARQKRAKKAEAEASFFGLEAQPRVEKAKEASVEEPRIEPQASVEEPKVEAKARPITEEPKSEVLTVGDLLRLPPGKRNLVELVKEKERRKAGVTLKIVEQRKPEPEEPRIEPAAEPKIEKTLRSLIQKPASPLGFQHSKNPTGIPASLENAITAIDTLGAECRYDVFHDRIIVKGHGCGIRGDAHGNLENVTLKVRQSVLERFGFDPSAGFILDALRLRCLDHIFDPVRDYLDELVWDGVKRLDSWLVRYCKAEDTSLNRAIGRKMLVAGVRRVREPGCKFDYIVVLEGAQGVGKSTLLKLLAGEDNFSDNEILGLYKREQQEAIQGVWIYEVAELEGLVKSEVTKVKLFASKTVDSARPAYGRSRVDRPRRCIFVATTNEDTYLRDTTGNRRFWPVRVGTIDLVAVKRDRDQLWAEAAAAEASGEGLVIGQELWGDAETQQQARMELDPWEDTIARELARLIRLAIRKEGPFMLEGSFAEAADGNGDPEWRVSTDYLLSGVLRLPEERQNNKGSALGGSQASS
jgi:Virulence-associated protein E-like domain